MEYICYIDFELQFFRPYMKCFRPHYHVQLHLQFSL